MQQNSRTKPKTQLIIERSDGEVWGRIKVKGNLIVESAKTLDALKKSLIKLALDFENVTIEEFDVSYDLRSFFNEHSFLNISEVATKADISPGLMRQYVAGVKFPSEERVQQIEYAIREIGKELTKVRLHKRSKNKEFV